MFGGLNPTFARAAEALYLEAQRRGLHPRVTSTYRSWSEQSRLYRRWLQGLSPLPAAPPGQSLHQYGFAFDMVSDDPAELGSVWNGMGGHWFASDPVHYEARRVSSR